MDVASIAAAFIAQQAAQLQMAAAAKLLRMNAQSGEDAAKLLAAAQRNFDRLANVAPGVGANLDISV
jgi:DNA polymerase III delta subunit